MKALVTGAEGFVGSHLVEHLLARGHEVVASVFDERGMSNLDGVIGGIKSVEVDLRDVESSRGLIADAAPDVIFHLAAMAFVPQAQADHRAVVETNVLATVNVLEGIRRVEGRRPRLLFVSSAEVYGVQPAEAYPLSEETPIEPANLYASTKAAAEVFVGQYRRCFGIDAVIARPFNHAGPRQSSSFALPSFALQVARIEAGLQEPAIFVGNLEARRDISDARDVVRAYAMMAESAESGRVYNLCSGAAHRIGDLLQRLLAMSEVRIETRNDPARMRGSDIPLLVGDPSRVKGELGWRPEIGIDATLRDILEDCRGRVGAGEA